MATDSPHDWAARPLLAHRYAWRQRLARHGAATSHAAWDVVLERAVLVEIYGPSFVAACGGVDALAARASQVEMLEHEAIVPLQDFGRWATSFFAAYPQFPDATLQERAAGTPLAVTDVQRLVRRLAGALDTAHAANVVHGHLTPARIVFDTDGRASVHGFAWGGEEVAGALAQNPYCSPARRAGGPASAAEDVYSLAAIVLFSLTGEPLSVHREVATDLLRLPGDIEAPDGLLPVLARALSRDPADRYPGAGALAADLLPALEVQALAPSAPQAAASIEKQERARPPRRSLAGGLRAAGAGLAAIGLLGLSALMLGSDADDGQDRGPVSTSTSASDERTGALTDARHHVAGERTAGVAPAMSAEACANEAWQHFVANGEAPLFRDENACRVALNGTSCPAPPVLEGDALRFTDSTHIAVGWHAACGATAHWIEVAGPTGLLAQRQAVEGDTEMLVEIGSDQPSEVLVTVTAFYDDPNLEWSHSRLLAR